MTAAAVVAIRARILTRRRRRRLQLVESSELDSGLLERLPDRLCDRGSVRRVPVDADALDLQLERPAVQRVDDALAREAERALGRPLGVSKLLDSLEHELAVRPVVEVDVALGDEADAG